MKPRTKFTIVLNPFTGYWRVDGEHTTYENKLKKITVYDRIEFKHSPVDYNITETFEMFGKEHLFCLKYKDKLKVKLTTQRENKDGITLKPIVKVEY